MVNAETTLTLLAQLCDRTDATLGRSGGGWHLGMQFPEKGAVAWTDDDLEHLVRRGLKVADLWDEVNRLGDGEDVRLQVRLEAMRQDQLG